MPPPFFAPWHLILLSLFLGAALPPNGGESCDRQTLHHDNSVKVFIKKQTPRTQKTLPKKKNKNGINKLPFPMGISTHTHALI